MKQLIIKAIVFLAVLAAAQVVISLDWAIERSTESGAIEALRVGVPVTYRPDPEIAAIQKYQVEHPRLGFVWKPSIREEDNVIVGWGDIPAGAITTDSFGFANSQSAAEHLQSSGPIDVVGVGASYMGGAQALFYDYFALNGLNYHNMAHGRFTLPQYNVALKDHALPVKPRWVIYGLNEVSYTLIPDFEAWEKSGMGWFEYHSGTWCGPSVKSGGVHDWLKRWPRAYRLYLSFMKKTTRGAFTKKPSRDQLLDRTEYYIKDVWQACRDAGVGFIVLYIPSRSRMMQPQSRANFLFEEISLRLQAAGIPYIDLCKDFAEVENPLTLYFQEDAHWNQTGVYRAARQILAYIENNGSQKGQP